MIELRRKNAQLSSRAHSAEREVAQLKDELEKWKSAPVQKYLGTALPKNLGPSSSSSSGPQPAGSMTPKKNAGVGAFLSLFKQQQQSQAQQGMVPDDFVPRVQSVLEATIVKNAQLQSNIVSIAEECDKLMDENRRLKAMLSEKQTEIEFSQVKRNLSVCLFHLCLM